METKKTRIKLDYYIQQNVISVHFLHVLLLLKELQILDNFVICGSLGLLLNQKLFRKINDIDLLCIESYYGIDNPLQGYRRFDSQVSHRFEVDKDKITCFKIELCGVGCDLLHNPSLKSEYYTECILECSSYGKYFELEVKLELPERAIQYKEKYIKADNSEESRLKHNTDIQNYSKPIEYPTYTDGIDDLPF